MKKFTRIMMTLTVLLTTFTTFLVAPRHTAHAADEVSVWAWDPKFNIKALEIAQELYQKDHPDFKLNIIENAQDDIVQKLNTALSSGVTDGLPQIVLIEDYRAKSFLAAYPDSFFPLSDFFKAEDFAPYKVAATSIGDTHYAVPFDTGVTGLYVRKDLLEQSGHKVEELQNITWDQLQKIGQDIYDKTGTKLLSVDFKDLGLVRAMINASGSWYTTEDGKAPNLKDNEALKEAFRTLKSMNDAGLLNVHNDWSQMLQAFNKGTVATVPQGNWITPSVTAEASQSGQWVVVPWPRQNVAGSVNASNLGGSSFYVLNVKGKEAAADFIGKTFGSSEEFYRRIMKEVGALGTYQPLLKTDAYDQAVPYFGNQKIYKDFAEWSTKIPAVNYGEHTYAMESIVVDAFNQYLNGADLDQVLTEAQQQAENQIQ